MANVTKGFGVSDEDFPWRVSRAKRWTRARMIEYLMSKLTSKNKFGLVLVGMLADCELERLQVMREYQKCTDDKLRRRLYQLVLKLDTKTLYFLRAGGAIGSGKVLLTKRETEESDEPSELAKLIKFRPQSQNMTNDI